MLFEADKLKEINELLPEVKPEMKGWGQWTGLGVEEKHEDMHKKQQERRAQIVCSSGAIEEEKKRLQA